MQLNAPEPSIRPPVFLGCAGAVLAVVLVVAGFVFFLSFLDSGANNGKVVLDPADSYGLNTIAYIPKQNLYIVRLGDGSYLALSDLDAANRAAATRCRAAQVAPTDPLLPQLVGQFASRQSPEAAGSTVFLRESCNRAVYDLAGLRLDADGPNLERLATSIDSQGRLTVDTRKRTCSERSGAALFAPTVCPK